MFLIPIFYAPSAVSAELPSVDEESLLIFQMRMGRFILSSGVIGYQTPDDNICLLAQDVFDALDFAIEESDTGYHGWFVDERNQFHLDLGQNSVSAQGRKSAIPDGQLFDDYGQLCINSGLLEAWFPISVEIDVSSATLWVTSQETLPIERRFARKQRRSSLATTQARAPIAETATPAPYLMFTAPIFDYSTQTTFRDGITTSGSLSFSSEFLRTTATGIASIKSDGEIDNARIAFGRRSPNGGLLGALNATEFSFGDVNSFASRFGGGAGTGLGVLVSTFDLTQPDLFDTTTLRGNLPDGWEVELYQNGVLIDFTDQDVDGEWVFENVPVLYGENTFRIAYFGPQGQTKSEYRDVFVGDTQVAPGEVNFAFAAIQDEAENGIRLTSRAAFALSKKMGFTLTATQYPYDDEVKRFLDVGVTTGILGAGVSLNTTLDEAGGTASGLAVQYAQGGTNLFLSADVFDAFESELISAQSSGDLVARYNARVSTQARLPGRVLVPLKVDVAGLSFADDTQEFAATAQASFVVGRTLVTNSIDYSRTDLQGEVTARTNYSALINARLPIGSVRGEVYYEIEPVAALRSVRMTYDRRVSDKFGGRLTTSYDTEADITSLAAGLNYRGDRFAIGATASHDSEEGVSFGLSFSGGLLRHPRVGSWHPVSAGASRGGAAVATVFVDTDGDGLLSTSEQQMRSAHLKVRGRNVKNAVPTSDGILLPRLATDVQTAIDVDMKLVDDPYLLGPQQPVAIVPRPGRVEEVQIAMVKAGEVVGDVIVETDHGQRPASEVKISLVRPDTGEVVLATKSEFDGFFLLDRVPYGTYNIVLDQEQLDGAGLQITTPVGVTVSQDHDVVEGIKIVLSRPVSSEPEAEEADGASVASP